MRHLFTGIFLFFFLHGNSQLQKAAAFDKMIADLWYYIQTDPFYKNNTTLLITTDHGRGKKGNAGKGHGFWVKGSGEAWLAMLGQGILPEGEINQPQQIWQKQVAATIAFLVGEQFVGSHPTAKPITIPNINNTENTFLTKINKK